MTSNPRHITSADLFFFFHAPKSFKKALKFLSYKTTRLHFSVCVYCNRQQKTSQHVKNNNQATRVVLFCSLHAVTSSVIYYSTHTRENVIYLLNRNSEYRNHFNISTFRLGLSHHPKCYQVTENRFTYIDKTGLLI